MNRKIFFAVCISIVLLVSYLGAAERVDGNGSPGRLAKTYIADTGHFDGNRIYDDLENNGMLVSHRISGHSGMEWPKDTHLYINYASGFWVAGMVGGEIRTAVAEYGPEFVAGPYDGDAGASKHQLYIVNKSDLADPLASDDFQNWPTDLGAPWVDEDGDKIYNPLPLGPDHPEFIGDQVIWWVMNDGELAGHSIYNTLPLGIEVQVTLWGYNRPDAFGDMMFVKGLIINKGGNDVDSTFIGLWADPDLGYAGDDFVGCDTTLSLGFCYNDGADSDYGSDPPAIGYDFFQGPIVESPGDTAFAFGKYIPGKKNLPMSSFSKYINGSEVYKDPNTAQEAYNYMNGFLRDGTPFPVEATGGSKFIHPSDPNDNVDANDDVLVDSDLDASGDRRFLMNTGPFTLAVGDSQEVVFGMLIARGSDAKSSVTALKIADKLAQLAYDIQFALPNSPTPPNVSVTELKDRIVLNWDDGVNAVESYEAIDVIDKLPVPVVFDTTWVTDIFATVTFDTIISGTDTTILADTSYTWEQVVDNIDTTFQGQDTKFSFQGYNVYQLESAAGQGARKRIATYDIVDGITEIFDDVFDPALGETINKRVQFGSDVGLKRSMVIDEDALNANIPLKINRAYYFAVTAYGYNPFGLPKTLESPLNIMTLRPQLPYNDTALLVPESDITVTHAEGGSDGSVVIKVVQPDQLVDGSFKVVFDADRDWYLVNATSLDTVISKNTNQSGDDDYPIVNGMIVKAIGPDLLISDWDWEDGDPSTLYPDYDRGRWISGSDWGGAALFGGVGMAHIFWGADPGVDAAEYKKVELRFTPMTGYTDSNGNGSYDSEEPYTFDVSEGQKAFMYETWASGTDNFVGFNDVPFQAWDVEDPDNPRQLNLVIRDRDTNGQWDIAGGAPYNYVWIMADDYDETGAAWDPVNGQDHDLFYDLIFDDGAVPAYYVGWFVNRGSREFLAIGGTMTLIPNYVNSAADIFTFSITAPATMAADPDKINVWPNPYFGYNPEERNPLERQMTFTHLPETATIRIFNLAGELVRKIDHGGGQFETWDLTNNFNIRVSSGMYIAHIESDVGDAILKLAIILPEERLDVY